MSLIRTFYYQLKPWLPWQLRIALRRNLARRRREHFAECWPISEQAGRPPANWPGWPEGKKFALVLTHDIESECGVGNCWPLLEMERSLGYRSSFNFVPQGEYAVPAELRARIAREGFEIGVHDLRHDGKLYRSRAAFRSHAAQINGYLKEWNAVGFRSAFMLHELGWLHDLNVLYDSSTFDTDPFEPQPDGVHTIFPFWVPGAAGSGYVELPYTLVQDCTLFLVLREQSPELWKRKLDWIAEHGGMALLDTHPDYIAFEGQTLARSYPAGYYREFLEHIQKRYAGQFWHPLPREMAAYVSGTAKTEPGAHAIKAPVEVRTVEPRAKGKIWIDLDNTPHVPFFLPIIAELKRRGHEVLLTARDAFQVCALADFHRMPYRKVGRHYGKNKVAKVLGLFYRASQLMPLAVRERPSLGLSHGSRSQIIACNILRIPTILVADYEHARTPPFMRPCWELAPESIPADVLHCRNGQVRKYSGIKEDVYAWTLAPDASVLRKLGVEEDHIVAVVRPPATEAHYHNPESELLFERSMARLHGHSNVFVILLPRNRRQEQWIRSRWPAWFQGNRVVIPEEALDGLNLIWHADFVISGGGTMNRESAALGVPVYSIFRGPTGAVDRHLQAEGRLTMITSVEEVDRKIQIARRSKTGSPSAQPRPALREIVAHIESILELEMKGRRG